MKVNMGRCLGIAKINALQIQEPTKPLKFVPAINSVLKVSDLDAVQTQD